MSQRQTVILYFHKHSLMSCLGDKLSSCISTNTLLCHVSETNCHPVFPQTLSDVMSQRQTVVIYFHKHSLMSCLRDKLSSCISTNTLLCHVSETNCHPVFPQTLSDVMSQRQTVVIYFHKHSLMSCLRDKLSSCISTNTL